MHAITNRAMKFIFFVSMRELNEIAEVRMSMFIAFCLLLKVTSARFLHPHTLERVLVCIAFQLSPAVVNRNELACRTEMREILTAQSTS